MRNEDSNNGHPIKVTREIPLWGLVSAVVAVVGQAVAMYYGQQDLSKRQTEMASDIRQIKEEVGRTSQQAIEKSFQLGDLSRRVTVLEAAQQVKGSR